MKKRVSRKSERLSEQLRRIIEDSELSRYEISKQSGIDASQLHRFVKGKGRLTTDSLDRIGIVLKLKLMTDEQG